MNRSPKFLERLRGEVRPTGATDAESRWLDAAAGEEPSPELRERMARGVGLSTAAIAAHVAATKPSASPPAVFPALPMRIVFWLSAGIATVAAVGAVVAVRGHEASRASPAGPSVVRSSAAPIAGPPLASAAQAGTQDATQPPASPAITPPPAASLPTVRAHGPAEAPHDDLAGQVILIDKARSALASGLPDRALDLLGRYRSRYPVGSFRPEATALRIEALAGVGRSDEARALAERFMSEHPGSPLADRVAREVGASPR